MNKRQNYTLLVIFFSFLSRILAQDISNATVCTKGTIYPRSEAERWSDVKNVKDFGASPSNNAVANTDAFNAAIAASSRIYIPAGIYDLNSLADIVSSITITGDGPTSILRFNTTEIGIHINPGVSNQRQTWTFRDLSFKNSGSTPKSFIQNDYGLNVLIERCFFNDCSVNYCIDNWTGYGLTLNSCVFYYINGTGVRLRDNNASPRYSYVTRINDTDFTSCSVAAVEDEGHGSGPIYFRGCIFQGGGAGVVCNTKPGGGFSWNLGFEGCYFEQNTGYDLDLQANGSPIQSYAMLTNCFFNATPKINLGWLGRIEVHSCNAGGGSPVVVYGSGSAECHLYNCINWTQNGIFFWKNYTIH